MIVGDGSLPFGGLEFARSVPGVTTDNGWIISRDAVVGFGDGFCFLDKGEKALVWCRSKKGHGTLRKNLKSGIFPARYQLDVQMG